jgi:hypothetical protein
MISLSYEDYLALKEVEEYIVPGCRINLYKNIAYDNNFKVEIISKSEHNLKNLIDLKKEFNYSQFGSYI